MAAKLGNYNFLYLTDYATISTILKSFIFFTIIHILSYIISPLISSTYKNFKGSKMKMNWDTRVVAFIHPFIIIPGSLSCLLYKPLLRSDPVFGYDESCATTLEISVGYFLWDSVICIIYYKDFGLAFLAHALVCLALYFMAVVTPFVLFFGVFFIQYEFSTPFVNLHWILDKVGFKNEMIKMINGALVIIVFFVVRIVFGIYYSCLVWYYLPRAQNAPTLLVYFTLLCNLFMVVLNFYWFYMIIRYVKKPTKKE